MYKRRKEKNTMRSPKEKEKIIKEMLENGGGFHSMSKKYNISKSVLSRWFYKYKQYGIRGLESNTGKAKGGNKGIGAKKAKTYEEELELKIMRLEIENERLKKGYIVKGDGAEREYVTTLDKNMK